MSRAVHVAALAAVLGAAVACGGRPGALPDDGPLFAGESGGRWCVPKFRAGGRLSHGSDAIENTGEQTIRVDDVSLVGAEGITVLAAYTRSADQGLSGTISGWRRREEAELEPLSELEPGARRNLVLELRADPEASRASFEAVELRYSVGRTSYVAHTTFAVRWQTSC